LPQSLPSRLKSAVALLLTFVAGSVDIVGYLTVFQVFTAHMTGTTVHLGHDLVTGRWGAAAVAAVVVFSFLLGSILGRIIIEAASRVRLRTAASITLAMEAVLLVAFMIFGSAIPAEAKHTNLYLDAGLLAILAAAMGLQTATLTRIGPLTVHTTFVTGMLNKLAQLVSHVIFHSYDLSRGKAAEKEIHAKRKDRMREARFIGSIWLLYLLGAIAGTWMEMKWSVQALVVPTVLLAMSIAADQVNPLSLEEEKDQAER
jgi:uncharacterized membrane protein YoaK (UPF0700 family)